jgi:aldehyde:ferredoxin oxidoreductase
MTGYSKLLNIDLTSRRTWTEPTDSYRQFIGGRGLNVALLYKLLKPGTDPLGPENVLIFSTGPVAGTIAPSSARYNVSARSPMTGFHGDSNSGGYWSPELRAAGYDGIIIHGKADRPLYVFIENDEVKLLEAGGIWGLDVWQTSEQLKRMHHDPDLKILCIGPAGERQVRFHE